MIMILCILKLIILEILQVHLQYPQRLILSYDIERIPNVFKIQYTNLPSKDIPAYLNIFEENV